MFEIGERNRKIIGKGYRIEGVFVCLFFSSRKKPMGRKILNTIQRIICRLWEEMRSREQVNELALKGKKSMA